MEHTNVNSRRKFLGALAATASLSSLGTAVMAEESHDHGTKLIHEADEWFKNVKGSHRIVYDGSTPHDGFAILWNWAFYLSNNQTGSADSDITAMSVLRHNAIPFALKSELWEKYNLGELFGINDQKTQKPSLRNPYFEPQEGDFPVPIVQGIKDLQARGAMFCVCDLALNVYSGAKAQQIGADPKTVYEDWKSGVLPGIQVVPSGVWALGRAQEHGCGYIFAGN
ncbi:Tat (twin-arginine translocation) pathway signal sequence containing protein [Algoriphagus chordae]|uniref:Secreted protein n=1 Tax=Algoriphagus chordae TaxID=237019 RepID=A0A2W7QXJ1_9BACT|nr:Tat (twin-arginine translocation) pathway signal sequence containing protein [Algoriphagus chordae]PZX53248.1 hypothetical protein LV85_01666 [Algoriphagus chordae]